MAFFLVSAVGLYAYAEFGVRAAFDPDAQDNQLAARYELGRLGMSRDEVQSIFGPVNFVTVGCKVGAPSTASWADRQHIFSVEFPIPKDE